MTVSIPQIKKDPNKKDVLGSTSTITWYKTENVSTRGVPNNW
jgi:hypothetical protein